MLIELHKNLYLLYTVIQLNYCTLLPTAMAQDTAHARNLDHTLKELQRKIRDHESELSRVSPSPKCR